MLQSQQLNLSCALSTATKEPGVGNSIGDLCDRSTSAGVRKSQTLLINMQNPYVKHCMEMLGLLRCSLQRVLEREGNYNDILGEGKDHAGERGWGAQGHMQRLDLHQDVASNTIFSGHNSPIDNLSPASSFQTDSGYGTTSPPGLADVSNLSATDFTQESAPRTKRR